MIAHIANEQNPTHQQTCPLPACALPAMFKTAQHVGPMSTLTMAASAEVLMNKTTARADVPASISLVTML